MTYTLPRYQSYQEYLDDGQLHLEGNYRLLSTGEVIEVSSEDDENLWLANLVMAAILKVQGLSFIKFIRNGNKELQVAPIGDKWVNRKPDILVLRPEHFGEVRQAIKFGALAPLFVAEIVSPGGELSDNYLRDYVWKRQQYQAWQIPEYWIVDPHRQQVTVLTLVNAEYQEIVYRDRSEIVSTVFPALKLTVSALLGGEV